MMRNTRDVASAIRQARLERGLTQAQLADLIGVGRDWVVRLEQGSPRLELSKVLDAFVALGLELTPTPVRADDVPDPFAAALQGLT